MLMPSIFGENLFDDFFNDFPFYDDNAGQKIEKKLYGRHGQNLMRPISRKWKMAMSWRWICRDLRKKRFRFPWKMVI